MKEGKWILEGESRERRRGEHVEVGKSETGRVEGGREASGRSESEREAGMEEQGKRKRGGTRNAGIDSRRQPATSLKHTTESTRLRDSETRFTTVTHHRRGEREREKLLD